MNDSFLRGKTCGKKYRNKERKDEIVERKSPSCGGVGRDFASLSRGEQSITAVSMTGDAYDRAGVGTGNRAPLEEPTKSPGNGRVAFGICFWGYLDRNLSDAPSSVVVICAVFTTPPPILNSTLSPFAPTPLRLLFFAFLRNEMWRVGCAESFDSDTINRNYIIIRIFDKIEM